MRDRWTLLCMVFCLAAFPVGLWGAGAFNPDTGWLQTSEALWRIFGLYAYFGMFGGWILGLVLLVRLVRRRCPRQRPPLP
jgi:hypothetical protein